MSKNGVWLTYTKVDNEPRAIAPFSAELRALRYASDNTTADQVVKATFCPFGMTLTEALARVQSEAAPKAAKPKPAAKPGASDD